MYLSTKVLTICIKIQQESVNMDYITLYFTYILYNIWDVSQIHILLLLEHYLSHGSEITGKMLVWSDQAVGIQSLLSILTRKGELNCSFGTFSKLLLILLCSPPFHASEIKMANLVG